METTKLAQTLKRARVRQKLTLRDIEKLSEGQISNAYVSTLERGVNEYPHPRKLRILATILKLNFLELMILADHITIKDLKGRV